jgi:hypothetical protein
VDYFTRSEESCKTERETCDLAAQWLEEGDI